MAKCFIITQKILKHIFNFSAASQYLHPPPPSLSLPLSVRRSAAEQSPPQSCQGDQCLAQGCLSRTAAYQHTSLNPDPPAEGWCAFHRGTPPSPARAHQTRVLGRGFGRTDNSRLACTQCASNHFQSFVEWLQRSRLAHSREGLSRSKEGNEGGLRKQALSRQDNE